MTERILAHVCREILEHVPAEHDLYDAMSSVMESAQCAAPEMQPTFWNLGQKHIQEYIPDAPNLLGAWHKEVIRIWTDNPNIV